MDILPSTSGAPTQEHRRLPKFTIQHSTPTLELCISRPWPPALISSCSLQGLPQQLTNDSRLRFPVAYSFFRSLRVWVERPKHIRINDITFHIIDTSSRLPRLRPPERRARRRSAYIRMRMHSNCSSGVFCLFLEGSTASRKTGLQDLRKLVRVCSK